jgi:hypothetical protein
MRKDILDYSVRMMEIKDRFYQSSALSITPLIDQDLSESLDVGAS